jgi:ceramide glucosyltransferase
MLYFLAAIALIQGFLTLFDGIRAARHMRIFRPKPREARERIAVFCPCKGTDAEFNKNIRSILDQDYPNCEVHFIVDSAEDPAYAVLARIGAKNILVAGRTMDCGQKVHNLAYAVRHAGSTADIYVFCDSDACFPQNWLSKLIAPLEMANITTGYRWYVASRTRLPTLMRSGWNASPVGVLGNHKRNFAWGGSTAMYRETFERLNILNAWQGSVSDDYAITNTAHRTGTKIIFVPECLIPTHGECTWRELFEFTTRQIVITRVYHPRLWRMAFIGHGIFIAAFFLLPWQHLWLWLAVYGLSAAKNWIRYAAVQTVLPPSALSNQRWFYILCSPPVALLFLYNMIHSALATDIVWRQIHYKLISPNETRVFGDSAASES